MSNFTRRIRRQPRHVDDHNYQELKRAVAADLPAARQTVQEMAPGTARTIIHQACEGTSLKTAAKAAGVSVEGAEKIAGWILDESAAAVGKTREGQNG